MMSFGIVKIWRTLHLCSLISEGISLNDSIFHSSFNQSCVIFHCFFSPQYLEISFFLFFFLVIPFSICK